MLTHDECYLYNDFVKENQLYIYPLIGNKILNHTLSGTEETIVDMGTGPGYLTHYLCDNSNATIYATDINKTMLELAQNQINTCLNKKNVIFELQDVHALTYANESIDALVSYSCLHHWVEPVKGLKECYRVLKPGGKIIIIDTHPISLLSLNSLKKQIDPKYISILEEAFLESYTEKHVGEMLTRAGISNYSIQPLEFSVEEFMEVIDEIGDIPTSTDTNEPKPQSWYLVIEKKNGGNHNGK
ncbi:class I SAM-dependent methyltransferase [Bacillus altitudinis]|uniref:class I SAM-dependent methyltransferase n=1 Tax=Bacillus altitudinis TaxID=293387 RepID=UPI0002EF767F|nr:class I SAM-dependent methyltransferase [Bacillus altitudinis]